LKGPVSEAAVNAIRPHVSTPVWGLFHFMLYTGCRPSEAIALKWSEIGHATHNQCRAILIVADAGQIGMDLLSKWHIL
jgi:hypothetical protein